MMMIRATFHTKLWGDVVYDGKEMRVDLYHPPEMDGVYTIDEDWTLSSRNGKLRGRRRVSVAPKADGVLLLTTPRMSTLQAEWRPYTIRQRFGHVAIVLSMSVGVVATVSYIVSH